MEQADVRRNKWIFQILAGKKPEETVRGRDKYCLREIDEFYRRIQEVVFQDELEQEYVENLLTRNYFIGMNTYYHIMKNYKQTNSVTVYIKINDRPRIESKTIPGRIYIFVPEDDGF